MPDSRSQTIFLPVRNYDLAATLTSGQAFRWQLRAGAWEGIIGQHCVSLHQTERARPEEQEGILARTTEPVENWDWLSEYLQTDVDLDAILKTFPDDEPMQQSITACRGLRLLRQEPWECLASFILSSTKQIVQIRQIVAELCRCFGEPIAVPHGHEPGYSFPTAARLAATAESELRGCKMGFRAPNLLATAKMIAAGQIDLEALRQLDTNSAREELMRCPGVGPKIANCLLLFAYGFQEAFPVDVWVTKALRELYFPKRRPSQKRLAHFVKTHFGPNAGYAQQYLFHYMRLRK
jgi:N-glycosylase/DNA lyase